MAPAAAPRSLLADALAGRLAGERTLLAHDDVGAAGLLADVADDALLRGLAIFQELALRRLSGLLGVDVAPPVDVGARRDVVQAGSPRVALELRDRADAASVSVEARVRGEDVGRRRLAAAELGVALAAAGLAVGRI